MSHSKQTEIDGNLARFLEVLPNILSEHEGRYALLRRGAIIGFFKDALDAQIEGNKKFDDGIFS